MKEAIKYGLLAAGVGIEAFWGWVAGAQIAMAFAPFVIEKTAETVGSMWPASFALFSLGAAAAIGTGIVYEKAIINIIAETQNTPPATS